MNVLFLSLGLSVPIVSYFEECSYPKLNNVHFISWKKRMLGHPKKYDMVTIILISYSITVT